MALEKAFATNDTSTFQEIIENCEMRGFFSADQVWEFYDFLEEKMPDLVGIKESIATTHQNNEVPVRCLSNTKFGNIQTKAMAIVTSAHHAREVLSVSMGIYTALKLVLQYRARDVLTTQLLNENIICFVPILNVDGYLRIQHDWRLYHTLQPYRKNGRNSTCKLIDQGVDLNRNYDYHWGENKQASSTKQCQEDFRGESPFSEPETQGIKEFVEKHQERLKLAINFHAFGNLWIHPFNCCPNDDTLMNDRIKEIYADLEANGRFPTGALVGNAHETIHYIADGEASDWYLGNYGIISISPELGTSDGWTQKFFINQEYIYPSLEVDILPIWYMIMKLNPLITLQSPPETKPKSSFRKKFWNKSYRDIPEATLNLTIFRPENDYQDIPPLQIRTISDPNQTCNYDHADLEQSLIIFVCKIKVQSWENFEIYLPPAVSKEKIINSTIDITENGNHIYTAETLHQVPFANGIGWTTDTYLIIGLIALTSCGILYVFKKQSKEKYVQIEGLDMMKKNSGNSEGDIDTIEMDEQYEV